MKRCLLILAAVCLFVSASAQRELRGVWIATVVNIDWPSKSTLTTDQQKTEMIHILDSLQQLNINAVVFQVRPNSDAFYQSMLEPWSQWLTGAEGREPDPFYDPLTLLCQEAHKRCMEVHAWINPYRVDQNPGWPKISNTHVYQDHPEWFMHYDGKLMFNPGITETRSWLCSVVRDIVKRYDVDAIHMDDYFYPYPKPGIALADQQTFRDHPRDCTNIQDWRRLNVTLAIQELAQTIHETKPWVQFGIAPFGVWRNRSSDPRGSDTHALQNYDALYADILLWMQDSLIDYVSPQLYWESGHKLADYDTLLKWWGQNRGTTLFYTGLAAYRLLDGTGAWQRPNELCRQIRKQEADSATAGAILFSCKSVLKNPRGLCDSLRTQLYARPAMTPCIARCEGHTPASPRALRIEQDTLRWNYTDDDTDDLGCRLRYFCIFRNDTLVALRPAPYYALPQGATAEDDNTRWAVSAFNRYNNESPRVPLQTTSPLRQKGNHAHADSLPPIEQ